MRTGNVAGFHGARVSRQQRKGRVQGSGIVLGAFGEQRAPTHLVEQLPFLRAELPAGSGQSAEIYRPFGSTRLPDAAFGSIDRVEHCLALTDHLSDVTGLLRLLADEPGKAEDDEQEHQRDAGQQHGLRADSEAHYPPSSQYPGYPHFSHQAPPGRPGPCLER